MESLDLSREFYRVLDRLEDRSRIGKISLRVGIHDHQEVSTWSKKDILMATAVEASFHSWTLSWIRAARRRPRMARLL
jgi:hypothetical protein